MDLRRASTPLGVLLLSGLLAGCGSGDEAISTATEDGLRSQLAAVRAAVAADRDTKALSEVAELRSSIQDLTRAGELDPADSAVLLTQVGRIEERLESDADPTPTPTAEPTRTAAAEPDGDTGKDSTAGEDTADRSADTTADKSDLKGNGKGNGKGKGKSRG